MISYIRTILYQYAANLPSKEYKNRYEPVTLYGYIGYKKQGYKKYHEGVYDKLLQSTQYNWRCRSVYTEHNEIFNKNGIWAALLPESYII